MNIERLLQVHVAVLTVLGAVLLGVGMQNPVAPVFVGSLTILAFCFNDLLGWFRLHHLAVEAIALLGLALGFISLRSVFDGSNVQEFLREYGDYLLPGIAYLLVFLQILFLCQKKSDRVYWRLLLLSLLEVVVASGMNVGLEFGLLLAAYGVMAFIALALFFLHRCSCRFEAAAARSRPDVDSWDNRSAVPSAFQQVAKGFLDCQLPGRKYARHVAAMALTTVTFAVVFFCSAPRSTGTFYGTAPERHTGFTREVWLNEVGPLLLSEKLVMRVSLRDAAGHGNYAVRGAPYFRGIALAEYASEKGVGRWRSASQSSLNRVPRANMLSAGGEKVLQEFLLEPSEEQHLFAVFPVFRTAQTPEDVRLSGRTCQLHRRWRARWRGQRPYRYELVTTAFRHGEQSPIIPHWNHAPPEDRSVLATEKQDWLAFDAERNPKLKELADRIWLEDAGGNSDPFLIARAMENHFLASGAYAYSLEPGPRSSPEAEPLEEFIANHRMGHCEYFASALTLMLRARGIPARMVIGYKGGDYNAVGEFYMVRELHTHAWVEAYLAPEQIPPGLLEEPSFYQAGAWLQLDPTPSGGDAQSDRGLLNRMDDSLGYAQVLWNDYVLGLNTQQQRSFFQPLIAGAANLLRLGDARSLSLNIARLLAGAGSFWRAGAVALAVAALLLVFRFAMRLWRRRFAAGGGSRTRRRPGRFVRVDFYQRLEMLLARWGLRRAACETQREFAAAAAAALADGLSQQPIAALPPAIVESFYRVRFGGSTLNQCELDAIERALAKIEAAFSTSDMPGSP